MGEIGEIMKKNILMQPQKNLTPRDKWRKDTASVNSGCTSQSSMEYISALSMYASFLSCSEQQLFDFYHYLNIVDPNIAVSPRGLIFFFFFFLVLAIKDLR